MMLQTQPLQSLLKLMFDLMATSDEEDLMLPLDEGKVEVWVTMAPTEKPDMVDMDTEYFAVNYIPADGVVAFTIAPASCTLLFPYAAVWEGVWNTGIAITNPSAFTDTPLSGDLTFTLFPSDEEMIMHSTDGMSSGSGSGRGWISSCGEHLHRAAQRSPG